MNVYTTNRVSPSKAKCEDAMIIRPHLNLYGVLDGATPVTPFANEKGENGAYIASHLFKRYFEEEFSEGMSLSDGIIQANQMLMEQMRLYQIDVSRPENLWSTCAAIVKINHQKLELAQLGDCMILTEYSDGSIQILTRDTVEGVSVRAKLRRENERQKGIKLPDELYYSNIKHEETYIRCMANQPDGYSVANGTKEVQNYIYSDTINIDQVKSVLLISDGLFHPNLDLKQVYQKIKEVGLSEYAEQLEKEELEDNRHADDKSGILIEL